MQISLEERNENFTFVMVAETVADAALLARFELNRVTKSIYTGCEAWRDGSVRGIVSFGRRKRFSSRIQRREK